MQNNNITNINVSKGDGRSILLIDGMNLFIKSFMVNETINNKSEPIGGVVGFIRSLRSIVNLFKPEKVIIAFEAGGGSPRRKKIFPDYKANRAKLKGNINEMMNRTTSSRSIKDTLRFDENLKVKQLVLLTGILKTMPVCQVYVKDVEGDDIIGYLAKEKFGRMTEYKNHRKIIVSSDKDYYQLLDDPNVIIYETTKKAIIDGKLVLESTGIAPGNYCLAKAIVGDVSDNIPGVPGVGFKSLAGRFKNVLDNTKTDVTIDEILTLCQTNKEYVIIEEKKVNKKKAIVETKTKKKKAPTIYKDILDCEDIIKRNWKLMYLNSSTMSWDQIQKIDSTVENFTPQRDQLTLMKLLIQEGINLDFNINNFALELQHLIHE